jgi:hypothetical protein
LITLQKKIDTQSIRQTRWYREGTEVIPVPVLGPDIIDPRQNEEIKRYTAEKLAKEQEIVSQHMINAAEGAEAEKDGTGEEQPNKVENA